MKNRKKLFSALLVSTFVIGAMNVNAMEVNDVTTLNDCLTKTSIETCVIKSDIDVTSRITTVGEKTLDLGTNTLNGQATVDNGLITVGENAKLTINGTTGKIVSGQNAYAALQVLSNSELVVNGGKISGYWYGIVGNGDAVNTKITINGADTVIESDDINTDKTDVAIYHPQDGILTINNGLIEGSTGIEIRAGKLVLNNGTVIGTNNNFSSNPNGNGTTTVGAGIAVVQHTTKKPIDVKIMGGNISAHIPFYENNPQGNSLEDIAKIKLSIAGGTFIASGSGTKSVEVHDIKNFISGGKFSGTDKLFNDYLVLGLALDNEGNVVSCKVELEYNKDLASATIKPENPKPGDTVTIEFTLNDGRINGYYSTLEITELGNNKYSFVMPNGDAKITFNISGFDTEYFVYTDALSQEKVNEMYDDWKGFNVYFSENALDIMKKTLASLVENLDDKKFTLDTYAGAEEFDFQENYEMLDEESKKLYDSVKKLLPSGNTIIGGAYAVVSVWDNVDGEELVKIDKLNEKITYSIQLPDAYEGKSKYYGLARVVDGKLEVIRGTLSKDGKTIAFNTDQLGSFIFVYGDIANPATYDAGITLYVALGSLSLIGLLALTLVAKKKAFNK